jgi:hypothetical protein
MFVSDDGVCEVLGNHDDYRKMKCTCIAWNPLGKCKHVKHMRKAMDENGGILNVSLPESATEEEVDAAMYSVDNFRALMVKYGKIEYIP